MNTGVQRSSATPPAARTAPTPAVGPDGGNAFGTGKSLPLLAMAHRLPYVATATIADLHDLEAKVIRAMGVHGARYLHVLVPCPLGWGHATDQTIQMSRLAVECGLFPVLEAIDGELWPAPPPAPASGKRVLVVGAGPSGLAAAYPLARLGHAVTVRDAMPRAGGMMRYGIPRYRLPRDIVDAEIQRIVDLGVTMELGARVPDVASALADGGFDACFAAVGAHLAKRKGVPVRSDRHRPRERVT